MAHRFDDESGVATETRSKPKLEKPPLYKVLMHNDHYTTRDFVVAVLMQVFRHSEAQAVQIMLHVHQKGVGVAGVYPYDIAETKVKTVERLAAEHEFPLRVTMEPED